MKKFLLVIYLDGETTAFFHNDLNEIERRRMDAECGAGAYTEVYERMETDHGREYVLFYS